MQHRIKEYAKTRKKKMKEKMKEKENIYKAKL